jgi:hypothetical protein
MIVNPDDRIVEGWASVEIKDNQGDIVPTQELYKALLKAMDRGLTINDSHSNRIIGKALNFWVEDHPTLKKSDGEAVKGIKVHYKIYNDCEADDTVWDEIKNGMRTGLSIGGLSYKKEMTMNDGTPTRVRRNLYIPEISSVIKPANPYALNDAVNYIAKGENMSDSVEQKVEETIEKKFPQKEEDPKKGEEPKKEEEPKKTEEPKKEESPPQPVAQPAPTPASASTTDVKLDRMIVLLEQLLRHEAEEGETMKPVEKPKEAMCKEEKPETIEKKDVIPPPLPPQTDLSVIAKGEQVPEEEDLAYQIAKGKKVDLRKMEYDAQEKQENKIKEFLKTIKR